MDPLQSRQIRTLGGKNSDFSLFNTIRFWAFRKVHITSYKITRKIFLLHRHFKLKEVLNPAGPAAKLASLDSSVIDVYSKWNELQGLSQAFSNL